MWVYLGSVWLKLRLLFQAALLPPFALQRTGHPEVWLWKRDQNRLEGSATRQATDGVTGEECARKPPYRRNRAQARASTPLEKRKSPASLLSAHERLQIKLVQTFLSAPAFITYEIKLWIALIGIVIPSQMYRRGIWF